MLSKSKIKFIQQLASKKQRTEYGVFVAEGPKVVGDLLNTYVPESVYATLRWLNENHALVKGLYPDAEVQEITAEELRRVSLLQHPQDVIAVFRQSEMQFNRSQVCKEMCLALDCIQDPGNLGTIIRIAHWFGIHHIFCSNDTVDIYNPKVVQATMGSLANVNLYYTDLPKFISSLPSEYPVYGTSLDGDSIYTASLTQKGMIVMGNEGNGISPQVRKLLTQKLLIPHFPPENNKPDSLNVAVATAIVCSVFRNS